MELGIVMFIAYIPFFIWMLHERRDQIKEMKSRR
jgi:hypothetical protein